MKILFLSHSFSPVVGGIETTSEMLAHDFSIAGHEVRLITQTKTKTKANFKFLVVSDPTILDLFSQYRWADLVFENNPCLRLSWPNLFYRRPSIVVLHTWLTRVDGKVGWQDKLKEMRLGRSSAVVACSEVIRQRCWPPAMVIKNAYRDSLFNQNNTRSLPHKFIFLGRLVSDKGVDLAIRALDRVINSPHSLSNSITNFSLTIVGEGPDKEILQHLTTSLGLGDRITFAGVLRGEQLVNCLNEHRYMIVPSRWAEPFGIVALEGMACGCIPIVSDGGGLPEAVGKAGLSFTRGDVNSLVDTILRLLENPQLEEKLRASVAEHLLPHKQHHVSAQYLRLLEATQKKLSKT